MIASAALLKKYNKQLGIAVASPLQSKNTRIGFGRKYGGWWTSDFADWARQRPHPPKWE